MSAVNVTHDTSQTLAAGFSPMPRPDWSGRSGFEGEIGPSNKLLVLGLGNDILCDDAIGLYVVREIRRRLSQSSEGKSGFVDVQETCEMGLSLLDYIIGYRDLVLVDSIQTRQVPAGHIHELEGKDIKILPVTTPHFLGVGEMMSLGRQLGLPVPNRVKIFAIEVQDPFTITTEMTPVLQQALPGVVDRILNSIGPWLS